MPGKITIDQSGAHIAAIESYYNVVEQDHRVIKRPVRPMMGFKSVWSAAVPIGGVELMHMIRKNQLKAAGRLRRAQQFYALAD